MLVTLLCLAASMLPVSMAAACRDLPATATPEEVVDAQFAAFNAGDVDGFVACYADDVVMLDLSGIRPSIKGSKALWRAFAYLARTTPGSGVRLVGRVATGNVVVDREHPLGSSHGKVLPDLIAVYEVRGGKIRHAWFPLTS